MDIDDVRKNNAILESRGIFAGRLRVAVSDEPGRLKLRGALTEGMPGVTGAILAGPTTAPEGAKAFLEVELREENALDFLDAHVPGWRDEL